jgi:hypothetical protein
MLHHNNPYIKDLKTTIERVPQNSKNFEIIVHADRKPDNAHRGRYNALTKSEVSLVIVGQQFKKRDIVLQSHDNKLQQISELHRSYNTPWAPARNLSRRGIMKSNTKKYTKKVYSL